MSLERRQREELAGNFVSKKYGFPFPKNKFLYRLIYRFYYSKHHVPDPNISAFFSQQSIAKLVFWHVQHPIYKEYSLCARNNNIPYIAVVGSWDRPTTKGPICPGCTKYIVNSQVMKKELIEFHQIKPNEVEVVGWPQMDVYHDATLRENRSDFLHSLKISPEQTVILYAGNASRLGAHEPSIVEHIAKQIQSKQYDENIHLLIRPHPQDVDWQVRYSLVNKDSDFFDQVTIMPAEMGDLSTMVNTLIHADIVIATQGSISLDAAALDKKIINVAFDGNLTRTYTESVKRWYEMDHYLPVIDSGGVSIVNSFSELDQTLLKLVSSDPKRQGRINLRERELEPFKGDSSKRQVTAMLS